MALHNLKITVIDGGKASSGLPSGSGGGDNEEGFGNKKSVLYQFFNFNQTIKDKIQQSTSPTTFFAIQQGISLAKQVGSEFFNYYVSDIGRSSGDSNYQAIVNRKIEKVTDMLSVGQGALAGAAMGFAIPGAGIVGAVIGAAFGVVSSGISLGFKYAERERSYAHEMFQQSNSQAYQLARANYAALTGRVR